MSEENTFPTNYSSSGRSLDRLSEPDTNDSEYSYDTDFESIFHDYNKVIQALKSEPFQRSMKDLVILSEFFQTIPEFLNLSNTKLELVSQAAQMRVIEVGEILVKRCSQFQEWIYILKGKLNKKIGDDTVSTVSIGPGEYFGVDLFGDEIKEISSFEFIGSESICHVLVLNPEQFSSVTKENQAIYKYRSSSDEKRKCLVEKYEAAQTPLQYELVQVVPSQLRQHLTDPPHNSWIHPTFQSDILTCLSYFPHKQSPSISCCCMSCLVPHLFNSQQVPQLFFTIITLFPLIDQYVHMRKLLIQSFLHYRNSYDRSLMMRLCSSSALVREYENVSIQKLRDRLIFVAHDENNASCNDCLCYVTKGGDSEGVCDDSDVPYHEGDLIVKLEEYNGVQDVNENLINMYCDMEKSGKISGVSICFRNDLFGYHHYALCDSMLYSNRSGSRDTVQSSSSNVSINSTPISPSTIIQSESDNLSEVLDLRGMERNVKQQSSLFPQFVLKLSDTGTVGRFLKRTHHKFNYKSSIASSEILPDKPNPSLKQSSFDNGNTSSTVAASSSSTLSLFRAHTRKSKFQRQSTRKRRSLGSNPDLYQEATILELESQLELPRSPRLIKFPIRIFWRHELMQEQAANSSSASNDLSPLKMIHLQITPYADVTEVVCRSLVQLELISATSIHFFLVQVSRAPNSESIQEKTLNPRFSNLVQRIREGCGFYLKHQRNVSRSLLTQQEILHTILYPPATNVSTDLVLLDIPVKLLVIRLFLRSHILLARIHPHDVIKYVLSDSSRTLKKCVGGVSSCRTDVLMDEYVQLSNLFKHWTMWQVLRNPEARSCRKRARIIEYLTQLALCALNIGHIDLFFNVLSGLESIEVSKLKQTWSNVSSKTMKILETLRIHLDVSGNLRNLRALHNKSEPPYIPVTGIFTKDMSSVEENLCTWFKPKENLDEDEPLLNIPKLSKMASLARQFCVESVCDCDENVLLDDSVLNLDCIKTHGHLCMARQPENEDVLRKLLEIRMEIKPNLYCKKSDSSASPGYASQTQPPSLPSPNGGRTLNNIGRKFSTSSMSSDNSTDPIRNHRSNSFSVASHYSAISNSTNTINNAFACKKNQKILANHFEEFRLLATVDNFVKTSFDQNQFPPEQQFLSLSNICEPVGDDHSNSPLFALSPTGIRQSVRHMNRYSGANKKLANHRPSLPEFSTNHSDLNNVSDKAAQVLGIKDKSPVTKARQKK